MQFFFFIMVSLGVLTVLTWFCKYLVYLCINVTAFVFLCFWLVSPAKQGDIEIARVTRHYQKLIVRCLSSISSKSIGRFFTKLGIHVRLVTMKDCQELTLALYCGLSYWFHFRHWMNRDQTWHASLEYQCECQSRIWIYPFPPSPSLIYWFNCW